MMIRLIVILGFHGAAFAELRGRSRQCQSCTAARLCAGSVPLLFGAAQGSDASRRQQNLGDLPSGRRAGYGVGEPSQ